MPSLNFSCLAWVEYDFDSGTMYLRFRSGRTYPLRRVPERYYYGLLNASSAGWYFNYYLKGNYQP
jgi:hypothetical protein